MGIDVEQWKSRIRTAVGDLRQPLLATSHDIHAHPELLFEEHHASVLAQAKGEFDRQRAAGEVAGRETWLARGREYAAGAVAE